MKRSLTIAILAIMAVSCRAWGQQVPAAGPILTVKVDPSRVVVGQHTTLRIEVLAPNYMTSPPELPDFQVRNAVTRPLQSVNFSEERNGASYAGIRFEFAIYPLEPGSYAISEQKVVVKYAADPPAVRQEMLALPTMSFAAFIPDEATGLNPYLAASRLTIDQSIQNSSDQLKVGDSVIRTVVIRAAETPAILLPPVTFPALEGLAVYPAQPVLENKIEGRTDALTATRTDAASYILQRPGKYVLPPIDVRWWNAGEGRIETAHLDAIALQVAANPSAGAASAEAPTARWSWSGLLVRMADHWGEVSLVLAGLLALAWIGPRAVRAAFARHRRRRATYLTSERFSFDRLRRAARSGDAKASYFALLDWLQRFEPAHSLDGLKAAADDSVLEHEVAALEGQLFAGDPDAVMWSSRRFIRHLNSARRRLRKAADRRDVRSALPRQINPDGERIPLRHQSRKPAR